MLDFIKFTLDKVSQSDPTLIQQFNRKKAIDFVLSSNQGEGVGVQNENETITIIENYLKQTNGNVLSNEKEVETLNTFKALEYMQYFRKEMNEACLLDGVERKLSLLLVESSVKECHKILMEKLLNNNGEYRTRNAMTQKEDGIHFYVDKELVDERMSGLLDYYNGVVLNYYENDNLEQLFKLAAHLAFNFVDIHPFSDGNGRTCRLLANHVLSLMIPFPVTFCCGENGIERTTYIDAIEKCRHSSNRFPVDLTLLLIESCYIICIEFIELIQPKTDHYNFTNNQNIVNPLSSHCTVDFQ